jgi:hypothetical protein
MDRDVDELRCIVAEWVICERDELERARYRRFGAELRALKDRIRARPTPPTQEELEIAMTAMLVIVGRQA